MGILRIIYSCTYQIVYCCWIAFELVYCYLFVIETKNRTLEETAALFDGEEALEKIAHEAAVHTGVNVDVRDDHDDKGSSSSYMHDSDKHSE